MSKNKRYLNSPDVEAILNQENNNIQIELFIKKDDNEGTDFYYIGNMKTDYESKEQTQIPNEKGQMLPVVNLQFDIEPSVPQNLYSYLEAKKMKQVTVSGAIILRTNPETNKKEIFATQRGYGDYKDGWEIPGGKLEPGETPQQCIEREIREELATEVKAEKILCVVDYDYPNFHLTMHCILCSIVSGELKLLEHEAARWLSKDTLRSVDWLPADQLILDSIEEIL